MSAPNDPIKVADLLPSGEARARLLKRRNFYNKFSQVVVGVGGISVIVALTLIFVYLFLEVVPMLLPASMKKEATFIAPGNPHAELTDAQSEEGPLATFHIISERYRELGVRFSGDGKVVFFDPTNGEVETEFTLEIPEGVSIVSSAIAEPRTQLVALGLSDGTALIVRHDYDLTYPDGVRKVVPKLDFPLGKEPVEVDPEGQSLQVIGVQRGATGGVVIAAYTEDGRMPVVLFEATVNFMTRAVTLNRRAAMLPTPEDPINDILVSMTLHDVITGDRDGRLRYYNIRNITNPEFVDAAQVVHDGVEVTALQFLLGTVTIIVGGSDGSVAAWMLVRDDETNIRRLGHVQNFRPHTAAVTSIRPEFSRKGFATGDADGSVALHFRTSGLSLLHKKVSDRGIREVTVAPRADGLLVIDEGGMVYNYEVHNPHPQASFQALWGKVQYEGYGDKRFMWQSSSATDEFEPKFSLVPLTVGTIKAALFAMLFATPIAILGAIYSAYFMTPVIRNYVKPCIEIMEALPTVILGFLAGLWLAPFVESHLPATFSLVIGIPLGILLASLGWHFLPRSVRIKVPDGWEAVILIPVIIFVGWACVTASPFIEIAFFNGDMRQWFTDVGIPYDQRNALIVGIAMGFGVIPTIFSISEDAVFNVPKHLTSGSLALGATPWQTMVGVVILTASPGLFSAVMIGMGRAVGETMIVLMASGNSPVMDWSIFQGLRTLSANIAVEMPETEVGGTHYRILFLSGLVLFTLTFLFNTLAEVVRQRLRKKYASL